MKHLLSKVQLLLILFFMSTLVVSSANQELKVGFQVKPPFIIKNNNQYVGVCMDLWKKVADSLNIDFTIKEYELNELLQSVENGEVDIAISPLTVTASRIQKFGFYPTILYYEPCFCYQS